MYATDLVDPLDPAGNLKNDTRNIVVGTVAHTSINVHQFLR